MVTWWPTCEGDGDAVSTDDGDSGQCMEVTCTHLEILIFVAFIEYIPQIDACGIEEGVIVGSEPSVRPQQKG